MFKRKQSEPMKDSALKGDRATWEERCREILAAGPLQPCMSIFTYDPMGYCNIQCQTGLPAGQPHEHRAISVGGFREKAPWGSGNSNPFENEDKERLNESWVAEPQSA